MDLTKTDGAGGCQIVLQRFFKEFPRIARSMSDVENIAKEGLSNECMFNKQDREEEENEEEDNEEEDEVNIEDNSDYDEEE